MHFLLCLSFPLVWIFFPSRNSYCWHFFLFLVSFHHVFHISFHTYSFIQKDFGLCGPNNVNWIKRVMGPICLDLSKLFCWRAVFCDRFVSCCRFVFSCRFAFYCRLLSHTFLYLDIFCSSIFFVGFWVLLLIGLSSTWAFEYVFAKMGTNIQPLEHMDCLCNSYANT